MAKRLTDSRKWDDPWFIKLELKYQMLWIYLLDKCNHIGLYKPALDLAGFLTHSNFTEEDVLKAFDGRIVKINSNWWIPKFIKFQYGNLETESRMHIKVLNDLKIEIPMEILTQYRQGIDRVSTGLRYKDKDKDKERTKDNVVTVKHFDELWQKYPAKDGRKAALKHFLTSVLTNQDLKDIGVALENYLKADRVSKGYIKNGATWFNNWRDWIDFIEPKKIISRDLSLADRKLAELENFK